MRILVTAGPTRERLDPVRFLSNRSTGKMGYALAAAAARRGHEVVLVSGPTHLPPPAGVKTVNVESAAGMAAAVRREARAAQVVFMAAAVSDYRPRRIAKGKIKKGPSRMALALARTPDILAALGRTKRRGQVLVGFAAETDHLLRHARAKLAAKNLDWIVANDVSLPDRGFAADTNAATVIARDGHTFDLPLATKRRLAGQILTLVLASANSRSG